MCFSRSRLISCVLCGESISSDEVLPNYLCSNCARKIPLHLASKFIGWNIYPPLLFFIFSLLLFAWGAYYLTPWMILPWPDFISWDASSQSYLCLIGGLVCTILALRFPDLASRKYKSWLMKSSNLSKIEQALTEDRSNPQTTIEKHASAHFFSQHHSRILFLLLTFILNGSLIGAFMLRNYPIYRETWMFTNFFGFLTVISNIVVLIFACDFDHKRLSLPRWRTFLRKIWIQLILLQMLLVYGGAIYLIPSIGGLFAATADWIAFLVSFSEILNYTYYGSMLLLICDLLFSELFGQKRVLGGSQRYTLDSGHTTRKMTFQTVLKAPFYVFFLVLLIIIIAAGYIFVIGDYFMFLSFFSINIVFGLVVPATLWLMQLIGKKTKHFGIDNRKFWGVAKLGLIFGCVFLSPLFLVPTYSTPTMDSQFQLYYGQSWETKAYLKQQVLNNSIAGVALPLRTTRYSFLDNLFTYNTTANQKFNIPYLVDFPSRPIGNTTTIQHTFYFDAYLPLGVPFGPTEQTLGKNISLPVVILLHGEVEDKGAWNANMTSQYFARLGFLVCDLNYGYLRTNNLGNNYTGYYLRDLVRHIGLFTQFLETHADYYHANLSSVFFGGRHLGGGLSLLAGLGYQSAFSSYFSSALKIKGLIPFYPVSDIGTDKTYFTTSVAYYSQNLINGSADPTSPDYNPDWVTLNPIRLLEQQNGTQIPIFFITGTHDWIISIRYSEGFLNACRGRDVPLIYAPYLLGNDGFDGNHVSPYGQHVIYYLERFLFINL